jgi:Ca-activated chloride channel homolog
MKSVHICLAACMYLMACGTVSSQQPNSPHPGKPDSTGAVSWMVRSGNPGFLRQAADGYFYLYINVKGNQVATNNKRVPLNISLVLDRSGSMSGDKIEYAKRAAGFVVEQLSDNDIVSIVNYDDRVEVTSASQPVKNKEMLKRKIAELYDRGSTNLTGGMLEGYTQVKTTSKDGFVNRVLLLTDGLANQGIIDPTQMKRIVEKKYKEEGIALSTFGLGADFNEDLLTMLAEIGRANYYFIDNPDKIPAIFASELKGLLSVVAQNATVRVNIPPQLECDKVYGYPFDKNGNEVVVRFNDVFSSDEKGILIRCRRKQPLPEQMLFECTLNYTDAIHFNAVSKEKNLVVTAVGDAAALREKQDALVEEMITLFEATEEFDAIMVQVDQGDYEKARVRADAVVVKLKDKQKTIQSEKLKKQQETIEVYSKNIESVKTMRGEEKSMYQKSNRSINYKAKKGKE